MTRRIAAVTALLLLADVLAPAASWAARCEPWIATLTSAQGVVEARARGESRWVAARIGDQFCVGDTVRVGERSRAALLLRDEAVVRLDQSTTITIAETRGVVSASWIDLRDLRGIVHFISRLPRRLGILTPFVNGTIEGTEFWVDVASDRAIFSVFEGLILAENELGRLEVGRGQSVEATRGRPPTPTRITRPRDRVQWTRYYPPIADDRITEFPDIPGQSWPALVRQAIEANDRGDVATAFAILDRADPTVTDPRFLTYRARMLLAVGRVDRATRDIETVLGVAPGNALALGLRTVVAVVGGDVASALRDGRTAVDADPRSATARIALSYAQQAAFDLDGALASMQEAVRLAPDSALAWARLSELYLSFRRVGEAVAAAERASTLRPSLARAQTVLGFARLTQIRIAAAEQAFEGAAMLDQADPLPRLGLGLALIRGGRLEKGRQQLEVAAGLDPGNSLIRSYLGKALYEERRNDQAAKELETAKALDPNDPTPWFYDGIRKETVNRPVEALRDLETSIALNDNRAVYRSRLLLDEDLAARGASRARLYEELGFTQLAVVEAWKSLASDPTNYSAHRFLAELYLTLPRHEVARVSEALQSQLMQPTNINPLPPHLEVANLFIPEGTGPALTSFNEFNPLFDRNRLSIQGQGLVGGNDTFGDEAILSGIWNGWSGALGQLHYETGGFRTNSDQDRDIYTAFLQWTPSTRLSVQAEYRRTVFDRGDVAQRFDPDNFVSDLRQDDRLDLYRFGGRLTVAPGSDLVASVIHQEGRFGVQFGSDIDVTRRDEGTLGELQYLYRCAIFSLIAGGGYFDATRRFDTTIFGSTSATRQGFDFFNGYAYATIAPLPWLAATVGLSGDVLDGGVISTDQINPKFGLTLTSPFGTTVRLAAFRTLERPLIATPTIEPTSIAGFNQLFQDGEGTRSWRYGVGVDQKLLRSLYLGAEGTRREMKIPVLGGDPDTRWNETFVRAYLYWAPCDWLAVTAEYQFEHLDRDSPIADGVVKATTHRVPLGLAFFHPSGFWARVKATYVDQSGDFENALTEIVPGRDRFWLADAAIGYRLPYRLGIVSLEAKNLFNERFRYQETDPRNPIFYPERLVLGRLVIGY
jgi:tetratricopeptide (TPR) repeat protein